MSQPNAHTTPPTQVLGHWGVLCCFTFRRDPDGRADNCVHMAPQKGPFLALPSLPFQARSVWIECNGKRGQSSEKSRKINPCRSSIDLQLMGSKYKGRNGEEQWPLPLPPSLPHPPSSLVSIPSFHSTSRHSDHFVRSFVRSFESSKVKETEEEGKRKKEEGRRKEEGCLSLSLSLSLLVRRSRCQKSSLPKMQPKVQSTAAAQQSASSKRRPCFRRT